jgi:hypothetical protein
VHAELGSANCEERRLALISEGSQVLVVTTKQVGHDLGRAVSEPEPHRLGRRTAKDAQAVEVLVLGDEQAVVLRGQLPHSCVRCSDADERPNVQRAGEDIRQQFRQAVLQLFIKEEAHRRLTRLAM